MQASVQHINTLAGQNFHCPRSGHEIPTNPESHSQRCCLQNFRASPKQYTEEETTIWTQPYSNIRTQNSKSVIGHWTIFTFPQQTEAISICLFNTLCTSINCLQKAHQTKNIDKNTAQEVMHHEAPPRLNSLQHPQIRLGKDPGRYSLVEQLSIQSYQGTGVNSSPEIIPLKLPVLKKSLPACLPHTCTLWFSPALRSVSLLNCL